MQQIEKYKTVHGGLLQRLNFFLLMQTSECSLLFAWKEPCMNCY